MGSRWQVEKKRDPYYKRDKADDYRSRASYKLKQLDKKFKIIKSGNNVVDLGAAPGGWSQVALEKVGDEGCVVGVDLNRIRPFGVDNFHRVRGDFNSVEVQEKIWGFVGGRVDVVMSDASPSLTGIRDIDHLRSIDLIDCVVGISDSMLVNGGNLVMKVFQGSEYKNTIDGLKKKFKILKTTKPASSRKKSKEMYVVGLKFKGGKK